MLPLSYCWDSNSEAQTSRLTSYFKGWRQERLKVLLRIDRLNPVVRHEIQNPSDEGINCQDGCQKMKLSVTYLSLSFSWKMSLFLRPCKFKNLIAFFLIVSGNDEVDKELVCFLGGPGSNPFVTKSASFWKLSSYRAWYGTWLKEKVLSSLWNNSINHLLCDHNNSITRVLRFFGIKSDVG